jgi:hypothetical protein
MPGNSRNRLLLLGIRRGRWTRDQQPEEGRGKAPAVMATEASDGKSAPTKLRRGTAVCSAAPIWGGSISLGIFRSKLPVELLGSEPVF